MRTRISSVASDSLTGDALPDWEVELGEGYLSDGSMDGGDRGGSEGDLERTERGEEGGEEEADGFASSSMMAAGYLGTARPRQTYTSDKERKGGKAVTRDKERPLVYTMTAEMRGYFCRGVGSVGRAD